MEFRVIVREARTLPHAMVSGGEALIEILVSIAGMQDTVRFLIDTGADVSILGPDDSLAVLGSAAFAINFISDPRSLHIMGIGGGARYVVRDAVLTFYSTEGERHALAMPILIAEPAHPDRRARPSAPRRARPSAAAQRARPRLPPPLPSRTALRRPAPRPA